MKRGAHEHRYMPHPRVDHQLACDICGFAYFFGRDGRPRAVTDRLHYGPYPHVDGVSAPVEIRECAVLLDGRWIDRGLLPTAGK